MASWSDFEADRPDDAALGKLLWEATGILYLATTRRDGAPRVHPTCPRIVDGRILIAIPARSPKSDDLLRDPRFVLHATPGARDDELVVRGRAELVPAHDALHASGAHWTRDDDRVFELHVERVDVGWWENVGQPDTSHVRHVWRGARHL